jgi:hypothetical protein
MTGWFIADVWERMTLPDFYAMQSEWEQWPPLNVLVAQFMGHKPPGRVKQSQNNLQELIDLFGAAGGEVKHG